MHTETDIVSAAQLLMKLGHGTVTVQIHNHCIERIETTMKTRSSHDLARVSCRAVAETGRR